MGSPTTVDGDRFTTAGLPAGQRVARWEAWNVGALLGLRAVPARGTVLEAAQLSRRLPGATVARVRASAHEVARGPGEVGTAPAAAVALFLPLGPASRFEVGRTTSLARGTLLVCDADRPFARAFPHGVDEIVLTVPRPRRLDLPEPAVLQLDGTVAGRSLAASLARELVAGADRVWRLAPLAAAVLDELLGVPRPPDRLDLARAFIAHHLVDPSLTAATIAAALGISERQLSRAFADAGTSVPREVVEQRVQRARILLEREPGAAPGEIARRVGMRSASYFTKRFTARFGTTPGRWAGSVRSVSVSAVVRDGA